ncbi:MAG: leucine--tRNA ligase [Bacteroidetes bacterium]|nr:MAG: leucine--tRNA ligase [Bacteroidota bacterium]
MASYNPASLEKKWQQTWAEKGLYRAENESDKPKFYVLDMFPYPSGAGLHVGHPLGYIASDIYARYKRLQGFNVLHPMGYDAFGLPAEQYAIQTGQHPAITTEENIKRYREQLDKIGFSFDWDRQVKTCDADYYHWTQWIFLKLYDAWFNPSKQKAEPISELLNILSTQGYAGNSDDALTGSFELDIPAFSAADWNSFTEAQQEEVLLNFRLAYLSETYVNWCPALGTVLANEEVKDGVSERGGHPVERKKMKQWSLRITAYSERLLEGLNRIDWSESIKDTQRNWIGKSEGCSIFFDVEGSNEKIEVFTTRPDTLFGVSFLTLAPEHSLVSDITPAERRMVVNEYINKAKNRTERERMSDVKHISGEFTGAYAIHPFTGKKVPIWVGDYVLAGYGTGAVMAVPGHDSRDHAFAKHFGLEIIQVVKGQGEHDIQAESYDAKDGELINSDFLNGMQVKAAVKKMIGEIEAKGLGKGKTNYRLRDAIFGRQRYWGEPIPIRYENGLPKALTTDQLPLELPEVDKFLPTEDGEPPLARAKDWKFETTTMPGWAGSSWYFLRYMDPQNPGAFADRKALDYWQDVDLYIGGSEHATGHLLYARFWMKFLFDLGLVPVDEPFKKLINQGMIQGYSAVVNKLPLLEKYTLYISNELAAEWKKTDVIPDFLKAELAKHGAGEVSVNHLIQERIDIRLAKGEFDLDIEGFKQSFHYEANGEFIQSGKTFLLAREVEKMSKRWYNVVNPDDICEEYGADTLRMYEMFLGPLEMSKPWNTNGIEGVYRFLGKFWKLFYDENDQLKIQDSPAEKAELKILHKAIKKVKEDIESFSFNTSISTFMITCNELGNLKCAKREILEPLLVIMAPFAPHITEELWQAIGHSTSVHQATFPEFKEEYLVENSYSYPVSINGKTRTQIEFALDVSEEEVKATVLADETVQKWVEGKELRKFIFVKGRIINLVV